MASKASQRRRKREARKAGATGPKPPIPTRDGKRKRESSDIIPDSEASEISRPISSQQWSHAPNNLFSPAKKRRISKLQDKTSSDCGICTNEPNRQTWKDKMETWKDETDGKKISWFQCEMKTCKSWYHSSCVLILLHQNPQSMLLCPGSSSNRAMFVCPKCISQPKKGYDKAIHHGMKAFIETFEATKKEDIERGSSTSCPTHILAALDEINFEPPREERYNGFDDVLVNSLVRNLQQSILDYDIEIQETIERSSVISDIPTQMPLAKWKLVDGHCYTPLGQSWFDMDEVGNKRTPRHASITTALRMILGTPDCEPLDIPANLTGLTYSQVHTALISWFVFDVIDNRCDMYGLPNMKPMRAMMAAVANAGDARWTRQGRQFLQEVQLRTWHKPEFQQTLLLNGDRFKQRLEAFLKPLTKDFDRPNSWSDDSRRNIIETTFRLWSYLKSLQGRLIIVQPSIGDPFDSKLHEAYDADGLQLDLGKKSKRKILWPLCRGFQYEEEAGTEDARVFTVKARVIVQ